MTEPTNTTSNLDQTEWIQGPTLAQVPEKSIYFLNHGADGVVIINFNGELTAFRNACLHQALPIHAGYLDPDGVLLCPWHNWCYDVTNGDCLTVPGAQLEQYTLRTEDDRVWVKIN